MPKSKGNTEVFQIRERLKLTQEEFANQIGVSPTTITAIEVKRRRMTPAIMAKIKTAFPELDDSNLGRGARILEVGFETNAMNQVYLALRPLPSGTRQRVISWVLDRLNSDEKGHDPAAGFGNNDES